MQKELKMTQKLFYQLMDDLGAIYISALLSKKGIDVENLTQEDIKYSMDYARSKALGITAEFETDDWSWAITTEEEDYS